MKKKISCKETEDDILSGMISPNRKIHEIYIYVTEALVKLIKTLKIVIQNPRIAGWNHVCFFVHTVKELTSFNFLREHKEVYKLRMRKSLGKERIKLPLNHK